MTLHGENTLAGIDAEGVRRRRFNLLIGGRVRAAENGNVFESINPATEKPAGLIPDASASDADEAVQAARKAFKTWSRLPYEQRRLVVLAIAQKLRKFSREFGLIDTLEGGSLLSAMQADAAWSASRMEYMASIGYEVKGVATSLDGNMHYSRHEPHGVVLRLLPFNHPIASAGTAIAGPLLMGNCVILKPSPHTSMSVLALGDLLQDIVPPGVVSILSGKGNDLPASLVANPGTSMIALTGSVEAGKAVTRLAAERLAPVTLELGGKNPLVIFPDFDVDKAVAIAISGMNFKLQGHSCGSTSRILVHEAIRRPFVKALAERMSRLKVMDPQDSRAEMGAICFEALYRRCLGYVETGLQGGAQLVSGGTRPKEVDPENGYFLRPTLFDGVTPDMAIAKEEIFGPILGVIGWSDHDRMLEIANGLDLGLTAVILSNDIGTALRTAHELECGYVEVNGSVSHALGSSFGGVKASGSGREESISELESYTRTKSINVRLN